MNKKVAQEYISQLNEIENLVVALKTDIEIKEKTKQERYNVKRLQALEKGTTLGRKTTFSPTQIELFEKIRKGELTRYQVAQKLDKPMSTIYKQYKKYMTTIKEN